jgi:uncharacterized protein (DUF427 family)
MKAVWNGIVIAEAPTKDLIFIERNWYFPPSSIKRQYLRPSDTPYVCVWKGRCQYFDIGEGDSWSLDNAFAYPEPPQTAVDRVKRDFTDYVAFWRDVEVVE